MNTELILKVAGIGVLVAVANQILNKTGRDEQATYVTVAGIVIVLFILVNEIGGLFDSIKGVFGL
ncbi:MAG: stage III sporulation protein AC [Clostridia bacterium]|nr:stage III sporulation protein AC [Clostridia bacterium]